MLVTESRVRKCKSKAKLEERTELFLEIRSKNPKFCIIERFILYIEWPRITTCFNVVKKEFFS